jgi:hypothetical protein
MVRKTVALLVVVAAVLAAGVSASSASTAGVRAAAGSCQGGTVAAVVNETFMCLSAGGPCSTRFEGDYNKFQLSCVAGRLAKSSSTTGPTVADAFLNTKKNDVSTRATTFTVGGPPPILHLTFKKALDGTHKLAVNVLNGSSGAGSTVDSTLQKGWQFTYQILPAVVSNATAGTYRLTISIDGSDKKQLTYSVKS